MLPPPLGGEDMSNIRVVALSLLVLASSPAASGETQRSPRRFFAEGGSVLDGDTLLIGGNPVRIAGIDAPELGPWARCWAEAALAGHAKREVERLLSEGDWRLADMSAANADGRRSARVVRGPDGEDLADELVVSGYAARTTGRWDWCGGNANLHDPLDNEPAPYGPNLWWPRGRVFDPRAAD
jgi:endonuclease YncB( thermonuclease family)